MRHRQDFSCHGDLAPGIYAPQRYGNLKLSWLYKPLLRHWNTSLRQCLHGTNFDLLINSQIARVPDKAY